MSKIEMVPQGNNLTTIATVCCIIKDNEKGGF